jgi:DNA adenine methylase
MKATILPGRETAMATVKRQALRYFGGKWRIAPWIISHFPLHDCYVEPYGGGANVLLRKAPAPLEVYNDVDGEVGNFFQVLRERTAELIRAIELTPFSRAEWRAAYRPCDDPLERARRLYVCSWQSRGGAGATMSGWRFQRSARAKNNVRDWNRVDHLWVVAARLKLVQLESDEALRIIRRYDAPGTLFYVDPPYLDSAKTSANSYKHGMTEADHEKLARLLHTIKGMAIISHYDAPLYRELYGDWRVVTKRTRADNTTLPGAEARIECLWLSPAVGTQMGMG